MTELPATGPEGPRPPVEGDLLPGLDAPARTVLEEHLHLAAQDAEHQRRVKITDMVGAGDKAAGRQVRLCGGVGQWLRNG